MPSVQSFITARKFVAWRVRHRPGKRVVPCWDGVGDSAVAVGSARIAVRCPLVAAIGRMTDTAFR